MVSDGIDVSVGIQCFFFFFFLLAINAVVTLFYFISFSSPIFIIIRIVELCRYSIFILFRFFHFDELNNSNKHFISLSG